MKVIIFLLFIFFSLKTFSKELSCSKNGTTVYYINGVLSKGFDEVQRDTSKIGDIFNNNLNLLDRKSKVSFIPIHNPSYGPINDIAELYAADYYYRTGKSDGFSVFLQILQSKLYQAKNPSFLRKLTQGGYLKQLEYKAERLKALAAENKYNNSPMAVEELKKINAAVVNTVVSKMDESIRDGKKTLLVGHSQGNAVIKEAFKRTSSNSADYQKHLKNYVGVFHVASPVQNLPTSVTNVRSFVLAEDWIVNLANYVFPEFNRSPATHSLVSSTVSQDSQDYDEFNHLFSNVYLTPNANARSYSDGSVKSMQTIFKDTLSDLASDLKSNCDFEIAFCNTGLLPGTMEVEVNNSINFSIDHIFPISQINSDPHTCECHKVKFAPLSNVKINVNGSGVLNGVESYTFRPYENEFSDINTDSFISIMTVQVFKDSPDGPEEVSLGAGVSPINSIPALYCGPYVYK